jgi:hypothetical protein
MKETMVDHDGTGLDRLDVATHPNVGAAPFRRILAARQNLAAAQRELRDAVRAAHEAGDSWSSIGAALGSGPAPCAPGIDRRAIETAMIRVPPGHVARSFGHVVGIEAPRRHVCEAVSPAPDPRTACCAPTLQNRAG